VHYDWLEDDKDIEERLMEKHPKLTSGEAEAIIKKAFMVRKFAREVERLLKCAVDAYESGDLEGVINALEDCDNYEGDFGDNPASRSLRSQLLVECEEEEE
jgi:hypothetical protein